MSSRNEIRQDTERLPSMPYWLHKWTGIKPELHQLSRKKKHQKGGVENMRRYARWCGLWRYFSCCSFSFFIVSWFACLFVCFFVSFSCSGWNQLSFIDYWLIESQFIDWYVVVELWVYPIQVFGWLFDNVTWNFCLSVKIFVIKGCHQEMGSILLTNMRVIFATLDSIKINMVPHSASNARMDSQQLRRDQPP